MRTATALAVCRECGEIAVLVAAVTLVVADGIIMFDCPHCGRSIEQPSPIHAEVALLHHGCQVVVS